MYSKKFLTLGLTFVSLLSACSLVPSPDGSSTSGNIDSTSEQPTTSQDTTSTPPSSTATGFNRSNSIVRPLEDAAYGAPEFDQRLATLPEGVTQPTKWLNGPNDVYWSIGWDSLNAYPTELTDVQKILVVPVSFTDQTKVSTESTRENISKTFFGRAEDTGWESVASYYYKSSRGKLTLTGEVTQWINLGIKTTELTEAKMESKVINKIYDTLPAEVFRDYDLNQDGYLDALWIVYGAEIEQNGEDNFWAYVSWIYGDANMNKPYPGVYGWSSYEFMYEGGDAGLPQFQAEDGSLKLDAHTFIHETGHMLGLNDYYDYDGSTNPSGGIDMMGNNIIDHNAYSKFLLNWNQPYVPNGISEETKITLRPATTSGDFILLNPNWNGSVYDEYILIEYYTPTVLNAQDSSVSYSTNYSDATGHSASGARVWHVDSTLWSGPLGSDDWFTYTTKVDPDPITGDVYASVPENRRPENNDTNPLYVYFGASNTSSESRDASFDLLKLVDASGNGSYYSNNRYNSSNSSLFKSNQAITDWNTYLKNGTGTFNDGSPIGFTVRFGEMNANGIEVFLTKTN